MFLPLAFFQKGALNLPIVDSAYPSGGIPDGFTIYAMVQSGNTVFVGGDFTSIGGVARNGIAALDATTGTVNSWYPTGGVGGINPIVTSLLVNGTTLYVGGAFTTIGGSARNGIAAVDIISGSILSWYPTGGTGSNSTFVRCMCLKGNILYIGGTFTSMGGLSRLRIAALDITTASVSSWYPSGGVNGIVRILNLSPDQTKIFVGGSHTTIGGQSRSRISALDATSGAVLNWGPGTFLSGSTSTPFVDTLVVIGQNVFIGGTFDSIGGTTRNGLAALDYSTGTLSSWYPPGGLTGSSLTATGFGNIGNTLFIAGYFLTIGGVPRLSLAALDVNTGATQIWYPPNGLGNSDSSVFKGFALEGNTFWIHGYFQSVGGLSRTNIAKLNLF